VDEVKTEGPLLHLTLRPIREPERNRIREVYADKQTYDVTRLILHDRLFVSGDKVYGVTFDLKMGVIDGHPVATSLHGVVGDGYTGDGTDVDYQFRDIKFPATMPAWYFDTRSYASHANDLPI